MQDVITGRVWVLGDDVDTDGIIGGKYLTLMDPNELKKHVFEIALPEFAANARPATSSWRDRTSGAARAARRLRRRSGRPGSEPSSRTRSPASSSATASTSV